MANLPGWKGRELQLYLLLRKYHIMPYWGRRLQPTVDGSGETALRKLFQPTVPAAVGEFVSILSSQNYSQDISKPIEVPGVVEIVRALLGTRLR